MNKTYKSVWNFSLGCYVVASEFAKGKKKSNLVPLIAGTCLVVSSSSLYAQTLTYTGTESLTVFEHSANYGNEIANGVTVFGPEENTMISGNHVTVDFDVDVIDNQEPNTVYAALTHVSTDASVSNNKVELIQGQLGLSAYGGMIYGELGFTANVISQNNTINVAGSFGNIAELFAGRAVTLGDGNATVNNNHINVNDLNTSTSAYYSAAETIAFTGNTIATNNILALKQATIGSIDTDLTAMLSATQSSTQQKAIVNNNELIILNSTFLTNNNIFTGAMVETLYDNGLIDDNTVTQDVVANNNKLSILGTTLTNGRADIATVDVEAVKSEIINNELVIENSNFLTSSNKISTVLVDNASKWDNFDSKDTVINSNQLMIKGSQIGNDSTYSDINTVLSFGNTASISNNTLIIEDSQLVNAGFLTTVNSQKGKNQKIENNQLNIKNLDLDGSIELATVIAKGYSKNIMNNQLTISDSSINGSKDLMTVFVGNPNSEFAGATYITNNHLSINDSEVSNSSISTVVVAKKGYAYDVTGNTLEISNSTFIDKNIISPVYYKATIDNSSTDEGNLKVNISNNTVKITGNTTFSGEKSKIYGAYLDLTNSPTLANDSLIEHYSMNNNTVIIDGVSNLSNVDIYGSYIDNSQVVQRLARSISEYDYDITSGNTLMIHSYNKPIEINSVSNFAKYQFYIEGNSVISQPLLITNETVSLDYQNDTGDTQSVDLAVTINGNASLTKDTTLTLFSDVDEIENDRVLTIKQGSGGYYDAVYSSDGSISVTSELKRVNKSKALIEGQSAKLAFINQASDLIAINGVENAYLATINSKQTFVGFGTISAGTSRYKTGLHIDVDGYSLLVGSAVQKDNLLFGAFFEAGWSNYDSRNSFTTGTVDGDGHSNYRGGGVIARYDISNALYFDGSLHIGRAKTNFSTSDLKISGENVHYDSRSAYYGAHLGFGYQFAIDDAQSLLLSSQYLWTHHGGDDIRTEKDVYSFDSSDSHRVRGLARYEYQFETFKPYAGVGYEYEFDGKSGGIISGARADGTSLKGSTGIVEIGIKSSNIANSNFSFDMNIKGYVGKREGIQGQLRAAYAF